MIDRFASSIGIDPHCYAVDGFSHLWPFVFPAGSRSRLRRRSMCTWSWNVAKEVTSVSVPGDPGIPRGLFRLRRALR